MSRGKGGGAKAKASVQIRSLSHMVQPCVQLLPVLAIVVGVAFYYIQRSPLHYLSTYNREQMLEVFKGGQTWVVLCHAGNSVQPIPPNFVELAGDMTHMASFGVLDCNGVLPSGKTVLEKFGIVERSPPNPTVFVTGSGLPTPEQLPVGKGETFLGMKKWLRATIEPRSRSVASTRELQSKCLSRDLCALVLKPGLIQDAVRDTIKGAMLDNRSLRFAAFDSAQLELSAEKRVGWLKGGNDAGVFLFRREVSSSSNKGRSSTKPFWKVHVFDPTDSAAWTADSFSKWLSDAQSGELGPGTKVVGPVSLKKRKVVEKAKEKQDKDPKPQADPAAEAGAEAAAELLRRKEALRQRQEQLRREKMEAEVEVCLQTSKCALRIQIDTNRFLICFLLSILSKRLIWTMKILQKKMIWTPRGRKRRPWIWTKSFCWKTRKTKKTPLTWMGFNSSSIRGLSR
jgi:hypothetical protein